MALNVSFNFSISDKAKSRCCIRQNHFLLLIASQFLFFSSFSPLKIWTQWENDFVARFLRTLQISAIHFFPDFSVSAVFLTIFEDGAGTIMVCVEAAVPKHRAPTQVETQWVTARLSLSSRQVLSAILIPTKVFFVDFQINWLLKMVAKG